MDTHGFEPGELTLGKPEERPDGVTVMKFTVADVNAAGFGFAIPDGATIDRVEHGGPSELWGTRLPTPDQPPIGDGCAVPTVVEVREGHIQ